MLKRKSKVSREMYCGIDPGFSGALAIIYRGTKLTVTNSFDMPVIQVGKKREIDGIAIKNIFLENKIVHVFIEKAQTMP